MASLRRLIDALETHTGIPGPVIGRYADKLAEAGHMPDADLLPDDAATLIVALAGARAATEAVEAVEVYLLAPLVASSIVTNTGQSPVDLNDESLDLNCNPDLAPAKENVIACLGLLIGEIAGQGGNQRGAVTVEIRQSIETPFASIYVKFSDESMRRFVFAPSERQEAPRPWQEWQQIDHALFAAVAALFGESHAAGAERTSLVLH